MTEFELINCLTKDVCKKTQELKQGIGDDCAVFAGADHDWLITSDMLVENVHFDLAYTDFYLLGRKSLSVNLSDIAAMGGEPVFFTVNIAAPKQVSFEQIKELYKGLLDNAKESKVLLIGGDTSKSETGLIISITMLGKSFLPGPILRKGAKPGDLIYVTGELGSAALGLKCYQAGKACPNVKPFLERFANPKPRMEIGKSLGVNNLATAMIDVSDGLLADLGHIAESSEVGYYLQIEKLPLLESFQQVADELKLNQTDLALSGGEDYELVFTVSPNNKHSLENHKIEATHIGEITADSKSQIIVDKHGKKIDVKAKGYDHFH